MPATHPNNISTQHRHRGLWLLQILFFSRCAHCKQKHCCTTNRVRLANGTAVVSIASGSLASVPNLLQADMTGHVMDGFPLTLLGLVPFFEADCYVVFTKTAVTIFNQHHQAILTGWRDISGPKLWRLPLTATGGMAAPTPPIPQEHCTPQSNLRPSTTSGAYLSMCAVNQTQHAVRQRAPH